MMKTIFRLTAAIFALVAFSQISLAQQPAAPSASHLAAAREVAIGSGIVRSYDAIIEPTLAQLRQMNVTRPEIRNDLDQVVTLLGPEMEQQKEQMINTTARIMASRMTEAELKDIAAFFKSSSGMKYVQTQPQILDDLVKEIADWSQTLSEYVMIRARAEMAKRGHQLQ